MLKSIFFGGVIAAFCLTAPAIAVPPPLVVQATNISALELQQFVQALKQLQAIDLQTQRKMAEAVQKEGLSPERFNEIGQSLQNPNSPPATPVTEEERKKFDQAIAQITQIQQEARPKQERAIVRQGLELWRFGQIGQVVNQDPNLQKRVQQMLGR